MPNVINGLAQARQRRGQIRPQTHTIKAHHRKVPTNPLTSIAGSAHGANGQHVANSKNGCWRHLLAEQMLRKGIAIFLRESAWKAKPRVIGDTSFFQRVTIASTAFPLPEIGVSAADKGNAPMPQTNQMLRPDPSASSVINLYPGIGIAARITQLLSRTPKQHMRITTRAQIIQTRIARSQIGQNKPIGVMPAQNTLVDI